MGERKHLQINECRVEKISRFDQSSDELMFSFTFDIQSLWQRQQSLFFHDFILIFMENSIQKLLTLHFIHREFKFVIQWIIQYYFDVFTVQFIPSLILIGIKFAKTAEIQISIMLTATVIQNDLSQWPNIAQKQLIHSIGVINLHICLNQLLSALR